MSDIFGSPRPRPPRPGYRYRRSSDHGFLILLVVLAIFAAIVVGFVVKAYYGEDQHTACVVSDKDRVSKSEGGSEMRVYTDNCGTFVVSDGVIKTDFNSADRYAKIKVGKTYDITSYGFRFGLTSSFPKIIDATEVK